MNTFPRRRLSAGIFAVLVFLFVSPFVNAQEQTLQPELELVFSPADVDLSESDTEAQRLLFAAIEARFAAQRRYRLVRSETDLTPEEYVSGAPADLADAVLFVRVNNRLDNTLRVDFDLLRDGTFVSSGEDQLPSGNDRFSTVDRIATELTDLVGATFPGFGRIRFTNNGYSHNYYVQANDQLLGANIDEIDLPLGSYNIEVRRRDGDFSHQVGRRTVQLERDDFIEIVFTLDREAPLVPGYLRLTNPADRWRAIYTLRGSWMVPLEGFEELSEADGAIATATALFGHIPFRGAVLGVEASHLLFGGYIEEQDGFDTFRADIDVAGTAILGTIGLTAGPVSGVDFIARVGGGILFYEVSETVKWNDVLWYENEFDRDDYAFSGTVEFGFGMFRNGRFSLQTSLLGIVDDEDNEVRSWLLLGLGFGGRF